MKIFSIFSVWLSQNTKSLIPKKLQESDVDITDMFGVFRSKSGVFSAARSIFKANHAKIVSI